MLGYVRPVVTIRLMTRESPVFTSPKGTGAQTRPLGQRHGVSGSLALTLNVPERRSVNINTVPNKLRGVTERYSNRLVFLLMSFHRLT